MELKKEITYRCCQYINEEYQCEKKSLPDKDYCKYHFQEKICKHINTKECEPGVYTDDDTNNFLLKGDTKYYNCDKNIFYSKEISFNTILKYFKKGDSVNRFNKLYDFLTKK